MHMEKFEDAYLSFAKTLSIPNLSQEQEPMPALVMAFCKLLLLEKVVNLYSGDSK